MFLSAPFSGMSRSLWMAPQSSVVSAICPRFISATLLRVPSAPSSRSLMKIWNGIRPRVDSWGTSGYWPQAKLHAKDHNPLGLSIQPTLLSAHLAHTAAASLWGFYGRQCWKHWWSLGSKGICWSLHFCQVRHFITGYQAGQAGLLCESMLTSFPSFRQDRVNSLAFAVRGVEPEAVWACLGCYSIP